MRQIGFYSAAELRRWFADIDRGLADNCAYWQFRPFHARRWQWQHTAPELCEWLNQLSDAELIELEHNLPLLTERLAPWLTGVPELLQLCQLQALPSAELPLPRRLDNGVPGRKWQQVLAFAGCLPAELTATPLLEWCGGKGHLGRVIALAQQRPVVTLEWQQALCEEGVILAAKAGATMEFVHGDAFAEPSAQLLAAGTDAVALHACGDLHTTLIRHWLDKRGRALSISPCCYHLIKSPEFVPMSAQGRAAQLQLTKDDLQLPLQETVTAGASVRRKGEQESLWRLAFDEWQREHSGVDSYLQVPNLQKSLLSGSFTDFVDWAAHIKQLPTPSYIDETLWLARGRQRLRQVRRMELVAHVFRRPLELWLVLDRALFLHEQVHAQGQEVQIRLGEFCARELTPRNILLYAER